MTFILFSGVFSEAEEEEMSLILEVEGSVTKAEKAIEAYHPSVEIVAVYNKLLEGIAVKGKSRHIEKVTQADFVTTIHPVQTYKAIKLDKSELNSNLKNMTTPDELNTTTYTGKDVKVGVIDTGVDDTHPDLMKNVKGGFDLVDLDDEPQETPVEEGPPTMHGTHVAGIIAADGDLTGVAPDSDLYAFRALGPGGEGTSIQVIAAMEEAIEAGVDVMNLSLGNTVNGPDYPTSKAVDEAIKQGVTVVIANGNAGPDYWTVGAPATAKSALAVGAYQNEMEQLSLIEPHSERKIPFTPLPFSEPWDMDRDDEITEAKEQADGKIGMMTARGNKIDKEVQAFADNGAKGVLIDVEDASPEWSALLQAKDPDIPVAIISKKDRSFIQKQNNKTYFKYEKETVPRTLAPFSSKGPVSVNWMMKPDVIAPGVNILSTVPEGYEALNGTSMAAPHVTGAAAVLKEAHPDWDASQIINALKTSAKKLDDADPVEQGAGTVQIEEAINTDIIIDNPLLSFGKTGNKFNERALELTIENISNKDHTFRFNIPKRKDGITWKLPQSFEVKAGEKKQIPIELNISTSQVNKDMLQGWIELESNDETYSLPYLIVQESADYPRIMEFSMQKDPKNTNEYTYELYATEDVKSVELQLFDPDDLTYQGTLKTWKDIEMGKHEGIIKKSDIDQTGHYNGLIIVEDENGEYHQSETDIMIE